MAIYAGVTKPDYSVPDGSYPARLFQIIQLGSQRFSKNDKEWYSPQILLGFELPTLTYENQNGEETCNIKSGTYFLSMNPSSNGTTGLREIIDGLRGSAEYSEEELEKFDIEAFLGKECVVTLSGVESKGKVYQNIVAVGKCDFAKEGYADLKTYRFPSLVTTEDFKNLESLNIPDWIKTKIMESKEYKELAENEDSSMDKFNQSLEESRSLVAGETAEEALSKIDF